MDRRWLAGLLAIVLLTGFGLGCRPSSEPDVTPTDPPTTGTVSQPVAPDVPPVVIPPEVSAPPEVPEPGDVTGFVPPPVIGTQTPPVEPGEAPPVAVPPTVVTSASGQELVSFMEEKMKEKRGYLTRNRNITTFCEGLDERLAAILSAEELTAYQAGVAALEGDRRVPTRRKLEERINLLAALPDATVGRVLAVARELIETPPSKGKRDRGERTKKQRNNEPRKKKKGGGGGEEPADEEPQGMDGWGEE